MEEVASTASSIPPEDVEAMAVGLADVRDRGGRLFVLGVGGGAAHASHAVNDFRKLCGFEAYSPVDNVAELTARANDDGWETTFSAWLEGSRLNKEDALLVFSVGGGSREKNISTNIVSALEFAQAVGAEVYSIVGSSNGAAAVLATEVVVIPAVPERATPQVEAFQAVVWHLLVSHPALATQSGKWESVGGF